MFRRTMFKRTLAAGVAAVAGLATVMATALPAAAIKYGEPDDGAHPYVGWMVAYRTMDIGEGPERLAYADCSGTQMNPDTFLTAGHCVDGAEAVAIWYGDDLRELPFGDLFKFEDAKELADAHSEHAETHPEYDRNNFTLHDVGVVKEMTFDEEVQFHRFGELPALGYWDTQLALNKKNRDSYNIVGYGLQWSMPPRGNSRPPKSNARQSEAELLKLKAKAYLLGNRQYGGGKSNDSYVVLSNNATNGGICFGDSGGPTVIDGTDTVTAVISFVANNPTCSGPGGAYRIDTPDDLAWLSTFISGDPTS